MTKGKDNILWVQIILNLKSSIDNIYQCEVGKVT